MRFAQKALILPIIAASLLPLQWGTALAEEAKKPDSVAVETKKPAPAPEAAKSAPAPATSPGDVLAKVNGTAITRGEVDRAMKVLVAQNRIPQPTTEEATKQAQSSTLDQLISAELLYQAGLKKDVKDLDKKVADKVAQNKAKFATPAEFESALKSSGMTEKELADITRKDIVINNLLETEIAPKIKVSDEEIKTFYDQNRDKYFKQEEAVRASHILIKVDEKATPDEKKAARQKAEAIRKRVAAGEDFAAIAKSDSGCPSSEKGGDLGFFGHGQMVQPFDTAAFALKPGEISDVVETQFGYHIIKVTEKKAGGYTPYAEAKDKIDNYLKSQKMQKTVVDYAAELKKKATIEYPAK